ncbi:MAG: DNA mismatch endonuclease Vsr [bacterium]|nr:DNA mismatch endonuclease Vsr [bacterium]
MSDVFSSKKRSEIMSLVKGRDTTPERIVRSLLHRNGYRFSVHRSDLPGRPDIVLTRHRTVVFVNGCFWHDHKGCKRASKPQSNRLFWMEKIESTRMRDQRNGRLLRKLGWRVLTVWECETKRDNFLASKIRNYFQR